MKKPSVTSYTETIHALQQVIPVVLRQRATWSLSIPQVLRISLYFGESDSLGRTPLIDDDADSNELGTRLQASIRFEAFPDSHQEAIRLQRHLILELCRLGRMQLVEAESGPKALGGFLPGRSLNLVSERLACELP